MLLELGVAAAEAEKTVVGVPVGTGVLEPVLVPVGSALPVLEADTCDALAVAEAEAGEGDAEAEGEGAAGDVAATTAAGELEALLVAGTDAAAVAFWLPTTTTTATEAAGLCEADIEIETEPVAETEAVTVVLLKLEEGVEVREAETEFVGDGL